MRTRWNSKVILWRVFGLPFAPDEVALEVAAAVERGHWLIRTANLDLHEECLVATTLFAQDGWRRKKERHRNEM